MNGDIGKFIFVILFCVGHIVGCANSTTTPIKYNSVNKQKFVPITLNINSGKFRGGPESELADYIYESFRKSGLFARVDTPPKVNPVTVNIEYRLNQPTNADMLVGITISAASLLLIPVDFDESHTLEVEILNEDLVIKSASYTEKITTTLSFFHDPLETRKDGINKLLKQLLEDIRDNRLVPFNS
ncbi:MAG: hypothetical protein AB2535_20750 [Candidatus Thiodiazotropha endolucinida]